MSYRRSAVLAALAVTAAAATPASAGSPYYTYPLTGDRVYNPSATGVPNVPDLQGCVRWCRRDQNPCDPPVFKQADGRCNFMD